MLIVIHCMRHGGTQCEPSPSYSAKAHESVNSEDDVSQGSRESEDELDQSTEENKCKSDSAQSLLLSYSLLV